ncbi:hypothetical protein VTK26DRAFT_6647 [Humicola hyalothermophila]
MAFLLIYIRTMPLVKPYPTDLCLLPETNLLGSESLMKKLYDGSYAKVFGIILKQRTESASLRSERGVPTGSQGTGQRLSDEQQDAINRFKYMIIYDHPRVEQKLFHIRKLFYRNGDTFSIPASWTSRIIWLFLLQRTSTGDPHRPHQNNETTQNQANICEA